MSAIKLTSIYYIWPFLLSRLGSKRNKKCNFCYAAMSMMMSQILKFVDFTKTQKYEIPFLRIKKLIKIIKGYFVAKSQRNIAKDFIIISFLNFQYHARWDDICKYTAKSSRRNCSAWRIFKVLFHSTLPSMKTLCD